MRIFLWSDPKYFHMTSALVKSARYHGNNYEVTILLMDFNDDQKEKATKIFEKDSKIEFIQASHEDFGFSINERFEFYRNCRPRYFKKMLESGSDSVLTLGSNAIIRTDLEFIRKILEDEGGCDFCFMERAKEIRGKKVRNIHEADREMLRKRRSDARLEKSRKARELSRIVLLGTHGIRNNSRTIAVIERWQEMIEHRKVIEARGSDMGLFVKAYLELEEKLGLTKETDWDKPRSENRFVDTHLRDNSNIWFAKAHNKWDNPKYLEAVSFFNNWEYSL